MIQAKGNVFAIRRKFRLALAARGLGKLHAQPGGGIQQEQIARPRD